jgi:AcrR family transcriptional regulator
MLAAVVSNNQRVKRAQIIDAAKEVLATQGLAACTARAVADASPLTKSAIHYYFRDVDEIVDEAMAEHVDAMLVNLRRAADSADPPGKVGQAAAGGSAHSAGLAHPASSAHPAGSTHSAGSARPAGPARPAGLAYPAGSAHPAGPAHPAGSAHSAGSAGDPGERAWRVVEAYLATFADMPHAAFLWFEYWVAASRRSSLDAAAGMLDKVHALLVEVLPGPDASETAHQVLSWLLGTIVQQHVRPRAAAELRRELARITG